MHGLLVTYGTDGELAHHPRFESNASSRSPVGLTGIACHIRVSLESIDLGCRERRAGWGRNRETTADCQRIRPVESV